MSFKLSKFLHFLVYSSIPVKSYLISHTHKCTARYSYIGTNTHIDVAIHQAILRGTEQHRNELIGTKAFSKIRCMDKLFQRLNEKDDFP